MREKDKAVEPEQILPSEAHHDLQQGEKLQPSFTPSPNLKPTKDGFEGSSSSIPSFPLPSPSSLESFRSSSQVRSLSLPTPPYYHQTPSSASPSPLGPPIPSSESFPSSRLVRSHSFSTSPYKYKIPRPRYASPSPGDLQIPSPAANIKEGLIKCWKTFLAFPKRFYIKMREIDKEVEPDPILSCIEKYEIGKNMLVGIGISMAVSLMFSNTPRVMKTGMRIAACTLPVCFETLLIGLLLGQTCKKFSFLLQLLGIGLGIFAMSASWFSFLTDWCKWIPVVTGLLCLIILLMPVPAIISSERMISGEEKDLERGE